MAQDFERRNINIQMRAHPQTCTSCQVTVELWGEKEDQKEIIKYLKLQQQKDLEGVEVNLDLLSQVYDQNNPKTICQACGYEFETILPECPDCGLSYR